MQNVVRDPLHSQTESQSFQTDDPKADFIQRANKDDEGEDLVPDIWNPQIVFSGIYQVYFSLRYIPFSWIRQEYTWYMPRICFPNKFLFSYIRIRILLG